MSDERLVPPENHYPGCWEQHPVCARIHLRATLSKIAEAKKLFIDRRAMFDHPRYMQWRDECDAWLKNT